MNGLLRLHMVIVFVASSYITLGLFSPDQARELWSPYAVLMLVLAIVNLAWERNGRA
jgi:hypothetical protein